MGQKESAKEQTMSTVLENEKVRVLLVKIKPGEKTKMHSHPQHVVCMLTDQRLKFTNSDGEENEFDLNFGQALYFEPTTHTVENVGQTDSVVIIVELKE